MLAPDDRSILRDLLRPPVGMRVDIAVGTTFTLDLTSALVIPLAFASNEVAGSSDPIAVLEAIRSVADRVTVFAQAGHISVPATASDLMSFLEPMVYEVTARRPGYLFHPKVWVLRYVDIDPTEDSRFAYRLVCATRNLTDDMSWDAVVRLDGWVQSQRPQAGNRPLAQFVRSLPASTVTTIDEARAAAIDGLADELRTVTWELPEGASSIEFHALGVGEPGAEQRLVTSLTGSRILAVSPFLDDAAVTGLRDRGNQVDLVTRIEALDRLAADTLDGVRTWTLDPLAGLDDEPESTDVTESPDDTPVRRPGLLGGLHAKTYVVEQANTTRILVGSPNATSAGFGDANVEFAVQFTGARKVFGIDRFLGDDAEFRSLVVECTPTGGADPDPLDTIGRELERLLRRIASTRFEATVAGHDGAWTETVASDVIIDEVGDTRIAIGLLTRPGSVVEHGGGPIAATFEIDTVADITPFVTVVVSRRAHGVVVERSTIVRAVLVGDPPDRLDHVLARQVDTPDKFLRFIMLLLSMGDAAAVVGDGNGDGSGSWAVGAAGAIGLFETLARAVAERPEAIDDIDRLVTRLRATERGRQSLPEGFEALWDAVRAARPAEVST